MEMVKEENAVVEEKVMQAGMSSVDEFDIWFKENQPELKNRVLDPAEGYDNDYYHFAHFISTFCLELFCKQKGISMEDVEDDFTYPVIAAEFFAE